MKIKTRAIELLAPAKDLNCGVEAIRHGADAVYIGAPRFSARAAAGNTVGEIKELCEFAHLYGAKVYVAFNTILKEEELQEAEELIWQLYDAGADALIVQDMGITGLRLPPIPLHASTQMDNRTPEKVRFLENAGFSQVVLARELTLNEIHTIASQTTVPLEVFIHGALCVSYSGQCYISALLSGRSANRGACAQYCRLPYTLKDANGTVITENKHLLSLKDLNRSDQLEELLDAGVSSLKIEGRLKDVSYVKNITAFYRKKLDAILKRRPEYKKTSSGYSKYTFEPVAAKSFNRGFTSFYLSDKPVDAVAMDTPKSLGEFIGTVKEIKKNSFTVAGLIPLHNGDGIVFLNSKGELEGFRVNKVEDNRVFPLDMPRFAPKTRLYRNYDHEFEKLLDKPSAERKIAVEMELADNNFGFTLSMTDEDGARVIIAEPFDKEPARRDQQENIRTQLAKLGNTPYEPATIHLDLSENWFIPSSLLADMRRKVVEELTKVRYIRYQREIRRQARADTPEKNPYITSALTYLGNVSNSYASSFYRQHGVTEIAPAFELQPVADVPLMFTKHCIRYSLGICPRHQQKERQWQEPFVLSYKDIELRLEFDCKQCGMRVYK